jgi:hypothetical protein
MMPFCAWRLWTLSPISGTLVDLTRTLQNLKPSPLMATRTSSTTPAPPSCTLCETSLNFATLSAPMFSVMDLPINTSPSFTRLPLMGMPSSPIASKLALLGSVTVFALGFMNLSVCSSV